MDIHVRFSAETALFQFVWDAAFRRTPQPVVFERRYPAIVSKIESFSVRSTDVSLLRDILRANLLSLRGSLTNWLS